MVVDEKEVLAWMEYALRDLRTAKLVLGEVEENAAFHSQQAAEKALKAVVISRIGQASKTHELPFLARKAGAPKKIWEDCKLLNQYFLEGRYPGYDEEVSTEDARKAVAAAERVIEWSKKMI